MEQNHINKQTRHRQTLIIISHTHRLGKQSSKNPEKQLRFQQSSKPAAAITGVVSEGNLDKQSEFPKTKAYLKT